MSPFPLGGTGKPPQEGEFGLIPEGIYYFMIKETKETTSSKGSPQAIVDFEITAGSYEGSTIREWITFIKSMEGRNKHFLRVINQPYDDDAVIRPKDWEGQELRGRVRHKPYQGTLRSRITEFLFLEEEKEVKEAKEKIETTFGERTSPRKEEEQPPIQKEVPENEGEKEEDDIPF